MRKSQFYNDLRPIVTGGGPVRAIAGGGDGYKEGVNTMYNPTAGLLLLDLLRHRQAADDALDLGLECGDVGRRDARRDRGAAVGLLEHGVLQPRLVGAEGGVE